MNLRSTKEDILLNNIKLFRGLSFHPCRTIKLKPNSKSELQNVKYSNVSGIQMVGIQIPTVFRWLLINKFFLDQGQENVEILYQARGEEIKRLNSELDELSLSKDNDIRQLRHELTLLKADKGRLEANLVRPQFIRIRLITFES